MREVDVKRAAKWTRRRALDEAVPAVPSSLERQVWAKTLEEVQAGWLRGPLTEAQLVAEYGEDAVVSRRFGVEQKGDARVIDDLAAPFVNSAFGSPYNAEYAGVDHIVVVARAWLNMVFGDRSVRVKLSSGEVLDCNKIFCDFFNSGSVSLTSIPM